jgi:hypothetical protein
MVAVRNDDVEIISPYCSICINWGLTMHIFSENNTQISHLMTDAVVVVIVVVILFSVANSNSRRQIAVISVKN